MLHLSAQPAGNMLLLRCTGRIVAGEDLTAVYEAATARRAAGLVIDFEEVETLDAAGLGTLLRIRQWCNSHEMSLNLINLNRHVREVLALTALDSVIEIHPTEHAEEFEVLLREWACAES